MKRIDNPEEKKKKKNWGLWVLLGFIAFIIIAVYAVFLFFYSKTVYQRERKLTPEATASSIQEAASEAETAAAERGEIVVGLTIEEEEAARRAMLVTVDPLPLDQMDDTYNILLIGVDRRDRSWNGNSDTMILITLNNTKKVMYMTSFMRDLYADVPDWGIRKMNFAYAIGGGALLTKVLEQNYGVKIDNYAAVDFMGMQNIVDVMGGIDMEIEDYELPAMKTVGITTAGQHHLNGEQALTYSRIRHYGNSDFERTNRQRDVLIALMDNARNMTFSQLIKATDAVLPNVIHNLPQRTVLLQLPKVPTYLSYELSELRIPADGTYHVVEEILIPNDINETIKDLRFTLYSVTDQ